MLAAFITLPTTIMVGKADLGLALGTTSTCHGDFSGREVTRIFSTTTRNTWADRCDPRNDTLTRRAWSRGE